MDPQSVLALTATAGPRVIDDICRTLCIQKLHRSHEDIVNETKILNCNRHNIEVSAHLFDNDDERLHKVNIFKCFLILGHE